MCFNIDASIGSNCPSADNISMSYLRVVGCVFSHKDWQQMAVGSFIYKCRVVNYMTNSRLASLVLCHCNG